MIRSFYYCRPNQRAIGHHVRPAATAAVIALSVAATTTTVAAAASSSYATAAASTAVPAISTCRGTGTSDRITWASNTVSTLS